MSLNSQLKPNIDYECIFDTNNACHFLEVSATMACNLNENVAVHDTKCQQDKSSRQKMEGQISISNKREIFIYGLIDIRGSYQFQICFKDICGVPDRDRF